MKPLPTLDLLASAPPRRAGRWLFAAGLIACLLSGGWLLQQADFSRIPGLAALGIGNSPTPAVRAGRAGVAGLGSATGAQSATGDAWRLLLTLDHADGDRPVRLLALEPTPDGLHLRARVRAADLPAMRQWLLALTAQRPFQGAVLLRHEWVQDGSPARSAVHFEVEVDWPNRTAAAPNAVKPQACG